MFSIPEKQVQRVESESDDSSPIEVDESYNDTSDSSNEPPPPPAIIEKKSIKAPGLFPTSLITDFASHSKPCPNKGGFRYEIKAPQKSFTQKKNFKPFKKIHKQSDDE